MTHPLINITIPTYNRADTGLGRAIDAALAQTYAPATVTVIDDGSTDGSARLVRRYASEPRLSCVRLGRNLGAARAKNVSILCSRFDAITFHDSDDVPSPHKVLLQARAMGLAGHRAGDSLDWRALGIEPGSELSVDVVVGGYELVQVDGSVHYVNERISLVGDFFPNLQMPSKTEGGGCLINAGLFRRRVFESLGGYLDSTEEERELRNRTIAAGCVYYFVDLPLITRLEMPDPLSTGKTGFERARRLADRDEVSRRNQLYRSGVLGPAVAGHARVEIDLADVVIEEVINPENLTFNRSIPATAETGEVFVAAFARPPVAIADPPARQTSAATFPAES